MGKKKNKASKSKKKRSEAEPVVKTESRSIEQAVPESDNIAYAEYVSARDVMELVDSLSHDIEQLDKTSQSLQKEIAQHHDRPHRQLTALMIIGLILGIGIITVGYNTAKVSSLMDKNMSIVSTRIDRMKLQLETMNTSMDSMSGDLHKLNTRLDNLSVNVSTVEQSVSKVAEGVDKINKGTSSRTFDTRYLGRPVDPRSPWR